jgi:hypothetical protein
MVPRAGLTTQTRTTYGWSGSPSHLSQKVVLAGFASFIAILIAPCLALGQDSKPAQVPPSPSTGEQAMAENEHLIELSEKLSRQEAEIAALKELVDRRIDEERVARQTAEAKAREDVNNTIEASFQKNPKVSGLDGLKLSGFLQADMYVKQTSEDQLNASTGVPLNDDRFTIRRLRLRSSIERRYLAAVAEIDANTTNGPQIRPVNVEVTAKIPGDPVAYATLTVGLFKIPFGYEIGQSDTQRLFAERSNMERALFPGEYDIGARLAGGWRFIRYAIAVQNGEPLGESTYPARDPNAAKDVAGRLGVESSLGGGVDIQGGFSALIGKGLHKGTASTKSTVTWQDRNENGRMDSNELIVSPGTSGLPSQNFIRQAFGADLVVRLQTQALGMTTAYAEVAWAKNLDRGLLIADPYGPLGRDMREMGYYVAIVQDLGKSLQAGLRYDRYDPDRDSTDRVAATVLLSSQAVSTFGMALAARLTLGGLASRLLVQYDVNRNHLGRDQAGLTTNFASNVFTLRAEAAF